MVLKIPAYSEFELSNTDRINTLLAPIKESFNINSMLYARLYWDGKILRLGSHAESMLDANQLHHEDVIDGVPFMFGQTHIFSSDLNPESEYYQKVYLYLKNKYDFTYAIAIPFYHIGFTEVFLFTAPAIEKNFELNYLRQMEVYHHFIIGFKAKIQDILKQARTHAQKISYDVTSFTYFVNMLKKSDVLSRLKQKKPKFITKKKSTKYYFDVGEETHYLTVKEYECIKELLKGAKYQEIADRLAVSVRTVHAHINTMKFKLNCNNKDELIDYFIKNNLMNLFNDGSSMFFNDAIKQSSVPQAYVRWVMQHFPNIETENPEYFALLQDIYRDTGAYIN